MAIIGVAYTLLAVFELWGGRGDDVWRWPIMVLLLAHAAAISNPHSACRGVDSS
jgi:hypothetical protein